MPFRSLLLAVGLSVLLAGCGSEDSALIPQDDADRLSAYVAAAASAVGDGECDAAQRAVREAEQQLSGLPRRTDKELKANLREWLGHLDERIGAECKTQSEETPDPTATPDATETPTATQTPTPSATETPTETATPAPTATVDPGTGGDEGVPEEPPGTGGVPPGEDE